MINAEVTEILTDKSKLLTVAYFDIQKLFEQKYGKDVVVLMEIGTFFETYEVNNDKIKIGKAKEIAELLNIQLTRKNKSIIENSKENPLMAGVPAVSFEKHLGRIIAEQRYTIVIIKQKGIPPKVTRYLDAIISPGTNFDFVVDQDENNITSLVIDKHSDNNYHIGYSAIDVTTGKCYYNEVYGTKEDGGFALDEIFNYMHMHKTSEVVVTFADKTIKQQEIIEYLELRAKTFHIGTFRPKISYQNELFRSVFRVETLLSPIEHLDLELSPLASESLAILIDFVIGHDPNIIQKLSHPIRLDISRYVYLGNNALEQLNIIETPHNPSLFKLINATSTAMGKRLLKERLTHPIKDAKEINRRYKLSSELFDYHSAIESELGNIYDIERLTRRIKLTRLHPFELNYLYDSLTSVREVVRFMENYRFFTPPCSSDELTLFIKAIDATFVLDVSGRYMLKDVEENMIQEGIDAKIDELLEENRKLKAKIDIFRQHILSILGNSHESFVTINRLDKEGFYIGLTKSRFSSIKDELLKSHLIVDDKLYLFKDFSIKIQTNNVKITNSLINDISDKYVHNIKKIVELNKTLFKQMVMEFEKKFAPLLEELVLFISEIDVAVSNIKTSKKYGYTKPVIIQKEQSDANFIEIVQLRHPIIEANEDRGVYVPNDIILGDLANAKEIDDENIILMNAKKETLFQSQMHGILLYGINSSGKSSLMKAMGICVILAQAGFFVPAKSMRFMLFDSVFTRISGADNIAKGLSSFAVEMLELKNIFNRANKKSLILGDEISHSTETQSGVSIVASAILKLTKLESLFLFATHLHQLTKLKEIEEIKDIIALHLSVLYNKDEDKIIYDRKLKLGSGSSQYGLEFAKSLHMDEEFLRVANDIRKRLSDEYEPLERLSHKKTSLYNKELYVSVCAICGEKAEDVHHIQEQYKADDKGFIGHVNQNHKMVHDGEIKIDGFVATSKGLELVFK